MSFYQYFKENFTHDRPLPTSSSIAKGTRVIVHAKHDVGPVKLVITTKEDTTVGELVDNIKQDDPSIVTAVVYSTDDQQPNLNEVSDDTLASYLSKVSEQIGANQGGEPRSPTKMEKSIKGFDRAKQTLKKRDTPIRVEEDEQQSMANNQQSTNNTPQDPAKQQQMAGIDKMIAQRQMQMASLRQNAERAQQQLQAKQREIDQLMRQRGAIS